jgi:beta-galactosidase/beta-glucuronidase
MEFLMNTRRLEENEINHPRKLLIRKKWQSLNGEWDFRFDHEEKFNHPWEISVWPLKIQVPFAPETPASGVNDTDFHSRVWYQKKIEFHKTNLKVLLHFGAVDYHARVWINDHFLGSHEGGHTPFTFDVTEFLSERGEQIITVCADDDPFDLTKPRGKQDWQRHPHSIWYPRTTGIWQTVWLEEVNETYIERLRCTPLLERWEISCEAFIKGPCPPELQLEVKLKCGEKLLARDIYYGVK